MEDTLIQFETAKLAKEKGFKFDEKDEDFYRYSGYYKYGKIGRGEWSLESVYDIETLHWGAELTETIDTPTQSLLQRWLRSKGIEVEVYATASGYDYCLVKPFLITDISGGTEIGHNKFEGKNLAGRWDNHCGAFEAGLIEALKLIP